MSIKYRVWVKEYKVMRVVDRIDFKTRTLECEVPVHDQFGDWMGDFTQAFTFDEVVVMRSTGFGEYFDEVFSGDVVRVSRNNGREVTFHRVIDVSVYGGHTLVLEPPLEYVGVSSLEDMGSSYSVTVEGNIYENPDLIRR